MKNERKSHSHFGSPFFFIYRACLWTVVGFTALTLLAGRAYSAVTDVWTHRYNSPNAPSDEAAFTAVRDGVGNVIVAGVTDRGITGEDILVIKYSGTNGAVLWQKHYNRPANNDDSANAVAVDGNDDVIVTGQSGNSNGDDDFCTLKYSGANGALLWEQHYDGPAHNDDAAYAVAVDGSGDVIVTGTSFGDYYTAKYRALDGALLWEKRYDGLGNFNDVARAVVADRNRDIIVTGYSSRGGYNYDCYTAKYASADGALLWEQRYNGPATSYDYAVAVAVDGSNNVAIAGFSSDGIDYDYYTAKYAATNGTLMWEQLYDGYGGDDFANAMAIDHQGNVIVTGDSGSLGGYSDFYTAKYAAADGAVLWEKRFNGPGNRWDVAYAIALDPDGNVAVAGECLAAVPNFYDNYCTVRYAAADGGLLWQQHYDGPASDEDNAYAVVVDNSGNVMVTGKSGNNYDDSDIYTVKYAATNGVVLWEQRYVGSGNTDDTARSVAVDAAGNVVVTGVSYGSGGYSHSDFYTAKYSRSDGALLWEKSYNGPSDGLDQGIAVAVDNHGDVIVAGTSEGDYYTVKYAGTDGAVLWEQRFDGQNYARVTDLVLDAAGNAAVTGDFPLGPPNYGYGFCTIKCAATNGAVLWSQIRGTFDDEHGFILPTLAVDSSGNVVMSSTVSSAYYTVKFAAATGTVLWETNYHGQFNSANKAGAVAVDPAGNVIVTGAASRTNDSGRDYAMVKYAAADGALLWEKRFGEPRGGLAPQALTLDTNGNVIVSSHFTAKFAALDGSLIWSNGFPATNDSFTQGVAVDRGGNVIVTGHSRGNGGTYDYYTAKYAGADGALLWQIAYNGTANGDEIASGLALGPNGMIAITGSSDGNFGPDTTTDYATIVYRDGLPPLYSSSHPTGICLRFTGDPGRTYNIERADNVNGPWSCIATITAPPGGLIQYTNSASAMSFYRMAFLE